MSTELAAPYSAPTTITQLPNPVFGNEENVSTTLDYYEALDGTQHTYIRQTGERTITLSFENVGRGKMLEVREFVQAYAGEEVRLTFDGQVWRVTFPDGAITFTHDKRSFGSGGPRYEAGSFQLKMTGVRVSG